MNTSIYKSKRSIFADYNWKADMTYILLCGIATGIFMALFVK